MSLRTMAGFASFSMLIVLAAPYGAAHSWAMQCVENTAEDMYVCVLRQDQGLDNWYACAPVPGSDEESECTSRNSLGGAGGWCIFTGAPTCYEADRIICVTVLNIDTCRLPGVPAKRVCVTIDGWDYACVYTPENP